MNYEEFLRPQETAESQDLPEAEVPVEETSEDASEETESIEVQKAVVESLAADKAEQDEELVKLRQENEKLRAEVTSLRQKVSDQAAELAKVGDVLAANTEGRESNQISLLDRDLEIPDRFPGETRDQVLDAIKQARDQAEADGRIRRAQVLEGVLAANEPSGNLVKKREALEKFFRENQNILSGPVIAELEKAGIPHKHGNDYLLTDEILKRTY